MELTSEQKNQFMEDYYPFIKSKVKESLSYKDQQLSGDVINSTCKWVFERMIRGTNFTKNHISKQIIDEINNLKGYKRVSKHGNCRETDLKYIPKIEMYSLCEIMFIDLSQINPTLEDLVIMEENIEEINELIHKSKYPHVFIAIINGMKYEDIAKMYNIKNIKRVIQEERKRLKETKEYSQLMKDIN